MKGDIGRTLQIAVIGGLAGYILGDCAVKSGGEILNFGLINQIYDLTVGQFPNLTRVASVISLSGICASLEVRSQYLRDCLNGPENFGRDRFN